MCLAPSLEVLQSSWQMFSAQSGPRTFSSTKDGESDTGPVAVYTQKDWRRALHIRSKEQLLKWGVSGSLVSFMLHAHIFCTVGAVLLLWLLFMIVRSSNAPGFRQGENDYAKTYISEPFAA